MRQRKGLPDHDELFNLAEDPAETKDLAADHPDLVAQLRKQLAGVRAKTKAPPAATKPPAPRPEVWMMPPASPDGRAWRDLFEHPEQWEKTRASIDVIGYADHMLRKQFTEEELRRWLPQIGKWGLKLGLEVGAVKPWGPTGQKAFDAQRATWDRFQACGGKIGALALDEPLCCTRNHLKQPDDYAVEETAQFIALVRQHYPDVQIGDIEPYPFLKVPELLTFVDALQARLKALKVRGIDFFRVDVDWNHFNFGNGNWADLKKLEQGCRQRKLPFSLIYWAANYPAMKRLGIADDSTWYVGMMQQGYHYRFVHGAPDQVVLESWVGAPLQTVPETGEWTFTRSVLDFVRKFVNGP